MLENTATPSERPNIIHDGPVDNLIGEAGKQAGLLLGQTGRVFIYGDQIVELVYDRNGKPSLKLLIAQRMIGLLNQVARLLKAKEKSGELILEPKVPTETRIRQLMESDEFRKELETVVLISQSPLLTEVDGKLVFACGGTVVNGILAFGEEPPVPNTIQEAKEMLELMFKDFQFKTKADRSRAFASPITIALVLGDLLKGRAAIDLTEADGSQAGKGYRAKLCNATFNQSATMINFGKGMGSAVESFDTALVRGENMLQFDNVRGSINSQKFETFMTEDNYQARPAYGRFISIDPSRTLISMTSNNAEMTRDLANRCAAVRILKQPMEYVFQSFPEGDMLDHVRANQPKFLGAVCRIVQEWHDRGCPHDDKAKTKHDFRVWASTLNYIVTEILGAPSMFDGYEEVRERLYNPDLNWAREVGLALSKAAKMDTKLRSDDILKTLEELDLTELIPGLKEYEDLHTDNAFRKAKCVFGKKMKRLFKDTECLSIEDIQISKTQRSFKRRDGRGERRLHVYCFELTEAA